VLESLYVYSHRFAKSRTGGSIFALCRCFFPPSGALEGCAFGLLQQVDDRHTLRDIVVEHNDYKDFRDCTITSKQKPLAESFHFFKR
jgi:hypothetical protein